MTNPLNESNNEDQLYTATFTLTQKGSGPVHSSLKFDPLTGQEDLQAEAPLTFQIMTELVTHYLYVTGMVNEKGELLDPDAFVDRATVTLN